MGFLGRLFGRHGGPGRGPGADERAAMRKKYGHFRDLLAANNDVLEQMARLEGMLSGGEDVTIPQVREAA